MAEKIEIKDEWKALIGKESPPWTYEFTTTSVRAFARALAIQTRFITMLKLQKQLVTEIYQPPPVI